MIHFYSTMFVMIPCCSCAVLFLTARDVPLSVSIAEVWQCAAGRALAPILFPNACGFLAWAYRAYDVNFVSQCLNYFPLLELQVKCRSGLRYLDLPACLPTLLCQKIHIKYYLLNSD